MANRRFGSQFRFGFERMPVSLFAKLTFGSSGAVTLTHGLGIKSVVKNSTGDYTITLQDNYNSLMCVKHVYDETSNSGTAPLAPSMFIKNNAVTSTTPTIEIVLNSAGTATNPASGEILLLEIILNNSSVTT